MVAGEEDIRQSLWILLKTALNERIMAPDYGANLQEFLFEEIDQQLVNRIRARVENAILNHESRIKTEEVRVENPMSGDELLHISIEYTVRSTNNRYNLVYPFYLNEASV